MYQIFELLLQKYNVSTYKVSKDTGIAQSTLSNWKNGISKPKQDKLQIIADYFGVPLSYLIGSGTHITSFAAKLRASREENKMLQKDLAEKLGCSEKTISGYERGERSPKKDTLIRIAETLNVSMDYLVGNSEFVALSKKNEKDIALKLEEIMIQLNSKEAITAYGEEISTKDRDLYKVVLQNALEVVKITKKEKL